MSPDADTIRGLVDGMGELDEEDLVVAYEVGRAIAARGGGVLDAVAVHEEAVAASCAAAGGALDGERVARAGQLLSEMLGPFEMALRGYRESNEQLAAARRDAEQANRAKNEFLSRTSHELRTPLNAILGFGQLLEMDDLEEEQASSVHDILSAGRHLLKLIDEVLDISRIEAGRLTLSMEPVMVGDLADNALSVMRPLAARRGITLGMDLGAGRGLHVLADRQRLHQVLLNLISNAVKYNRQEGSVELVCRDLGDGRLRIEVADTGPGLTEEQLGRIFSPFDRLGAEETQIEGTGLGLALSKSLCEAMNCVLSVSSAVGEGTRFWLDVPIVAGPITVADRDGAVEHLAVEELDPDEETATILYIEDNPSNLKLVQRILRRRRQVALLSAIQGGIGIDLARRHRPDLVLLDLHLPDRHGSEVLDELRRDPATKDIPVVIVSADATPGQVQRLLDRGAFAYVTKPLEVEAFLDVVQRALPGAEAGVRG